MAGARARAWRVVAKRCGDVTEPRAGSGGGPSNVSRMARLGAHPGAGAERRGGRTRRAGRPQGGAAGRADEAARPAPAQSFAVNARYSAFALPPVSSATTPA